MNCRWIFGRRGLCVFAVVSLAGCQEANKLVVPPPPEVIVALPLNQPVQDYFETTGRTASSQRVELRAKVSGYLREIHFQDGQLVEQDQPLFVIEKSPFEVAEAMAKAALDKARAELTLAEQELSRTQALVQGRATTESKLDEHRAQRDVALANVASAEAELRKARQDLGYATVDAPFPGRISENLVDVGNLIQSGETLLARIEAVDPIYAYFTLSESDLLYFLGLMQQGVISDPGSKPISIELAIGGNSTFDFVGKLDYREFGIDPTTGTTQRRAVFENKDGRLMPGLFVRIRAKVGDPKPQLLVEERALGADQRGDFLLVVNAENIVEHRTVQLGKREGDLRVITSGLRPDDWVVINGLQRARPGGKVKPKPTVMGDEQNRTPESSATEAASSPANAEKPGAPSASPKPSGEVGAKPEANPATSAPAGEDAGAAVPPDGSGPAAPGSAPAESRSPADSEAPGPDAPAERPPDESVR